MCVFLVSTLAVQRDNKVPRSWNPWRAFCSRCHNAPLLSPLSAQKCIQIEGECTSPRHVAFEVKTSFCFHVYIFTHSFPLLQAHIFSSSNAAHKTVSCAWSFLLPPIPLLNASLIGAMESSLQPFSLGTLRDFHLLWRTEDKIGPEYPMFLWPSNIPEPALKPQRCGNPGGS